MATDDPEELPGLSQWPAQSNTVHVLHPGDVALAFEGERLETLLGSCVAVILTDARRSIAAMCHIVHASEPKAADKGDTAYASCAMQEMFTRLRTVGIVPELCHAYVFGGGNMFPDLFPAQHVGDANIRWVMDFLEQKQIDVLAQSVGGDVYRHVGWTVGAPELDIKTESSHTDDK